MLTVVLFTGKHCGACPAAKATCIQVADELGVMFKEVDCGSGSWVDNMLIARFNVMSIPSLFYVVDNNQTSHNGAITKVSVTKKVKALLKKTQGGQHVDDV